MSTKTANVRIALKIASFILRLTLNTLFYVLVIYLVVQLSTEAYSFTYQIFGNVSVDEAPGREREVQIKKGESTMNVATKLENNRMVKNKYAFYLKVKFKEVAIMPGTYLLNSSMTYDEILDEITDISNSLEPEESLEITTGQ